MGRRTQTKPACNEWETFSSVNKIWLWGQWFPSEKLPVSSSAIPAQGIATFCQYRSVLPSHLRQDLDTIWNSIWLEQKNKETFFWKTQGKFPEPFPAQSQAALSWDTWQAQWTARTGEQQQELTQPQLPRATYCRAAAVPRVPAANSWGSNPVVCTRSVCRARAACPLCAGPGALGWRREKARSGARSEHRGGVGSASRCSPISRWPRHQIHELLQSPML